MDGGLDEKSGCRVVVVGSNLEFSPDVSVRGDEKGISGDGVGRGVLPVSGSVWAARRNAVRVSGVMRFGSLDEEPGVSTLAADRSGTARPLVASENSPMLSRCVDSSGTDGGARLRFTNC